MTDYHSNLTVSLRNLGIDASLFDHGREHLLRLPGRPQPHPGGQLCQAERHERLGESLDAGLGLGDRHLGNQAQVLVGGEELAIAVNGRLERKWFGMITW